MDINILKDKIKSGELDGMFKQLYNTADVHDRYLALLDKYFGYYHSSEAELYSAGGRVEVIGNHTDHNGGRVLAAAVNLDSLCAAAPNGSNTVKLYSRGYDSQFVVDLSSLEARPEEKGTTQSLIRGVASGLVSKGWKIGGFDAYLDSVVPQGAGLSSSASVETLITSIFVHMFNEGDMSAVEIAKISQRAEREYFGKPCGLMDQAACACGGLLTIDFKDEPCVRKLDVDFSGEVLLAVVETGGNHADLTHEYASITDEMHAAASMMGEERLRDVCEERFYSDIAKIREKAGDRAVLRAVHFFDENKRVLDASNALENGDYNTFFECIDKSGDSSWKLLQNCYVSGSAEQQICLAVYLAKRIVGDKGACRVHGGGFGGTILAFVPAEKETEFSAEMSKVFGTESVHYLSVRQTPAGHLEI